MQKSRERGRYLVFFITALTNRRCKRGRAATERRRRTLQSRHRQAAGVGEGQAGRVPRRPVQQEQHRVEIVLMGGGFSPPTARKISRLTRSKTPRRRRASPGDWCDLHTNRHPARLGPAAHASGRGGPFAFARLPGSERGRSRLLFILRRWPRACCPAADERLGFRVTHWRPTPADGPHRAVVIARVGSLGCAFSALPSRAIHCPLRLLIDDEPSNKKAAEGRTGPRRRRHRRGRTETLGSS